MPTERSNVNAKKKCLSRLLTMTFAAFLALAAPCESNAQGHLQDREAAGVSYAVDGRWIGGKYGGYWPLRISVQAADETRKVTFRFKPRDDEKQPVVERTVSCEPKREVHFTLHIPLVGREEHGRLEVLVDGDEVETLGVEIELPRSDWDGTPMPTMLVIADQQPPNTNAYQRGVAAYALEDFRSGWNVAEIEGQVYVAKPTALPHSWLGYTTVDLVAVSLKTLLALPEERRRDLRSWARLGGNLILHEVGTVGAESADLQRVLKERPLADSNNWEAAVGAVRQGHFRKAPAQQQPWGRRGRFAPNQNLHAGQLINELRNEENRFRNNNQRWPADGAFEIAELGFGRVVSMSNSAFPGAPLDWYWLTASLTQFQGTGIHPVQRSTWVARNGHSARSPATDFMDFLIPGVDAVPIYPLLFLMSVFVILIGPLNYWFCWKRKQLHLLVITIPGIALVTSLVLFSYSAIAHGFGTVGRVHSFTILDQQTHEAVSLSRVSLHSGITPSDGVQVSGRTAVFPMFNRGQEFSTGELEWTADGQHMKSGWVASRTTCQFQVATPRKIEGGIEVGELGVGELPVENKFKWGIAHLAVQTSDGKFYYAANVEAGASAKLTPLTALESAVFSQAITEQPEGLPEKKSQRGTIFDAFTPREFHHARQTRMSESVILSNLNRLTRIMNRVRAPGEAEINLKAGHRVYFAICSENPGIETGLDGAVESGSLHVIQGSY